MFRVISIDLKTCKARRELVAHSVWSNVWSWRENYQIKSLLHRKLYLLVLRPGLVLLLSLYTNATETKNITRNIFARKNCPFPQNTKDRKCTALGEYYGAPKGTCVIIPFLIQICCNFFRHTLLNIFQTWCDFFRHVLYIFFIRVL